MRKLEKYDWGMKTIFAEESWCTCAFLDIGRGREYVITDADYDMVFHILSGTAIFSIGSSGLFEFGPGKTVRVEEGSDIIISGTEDIPRIIEICSKPAEKIEERVIQVSAPQEMRVDFKFPKMNSSKA